MSSPIDSPNVDSGNIRIWKNAEVWISDDELATVTPDGEFGDEWAHVGLLNGGSSIGQDFDTSRTEVNSWGGVLRVTDQNFTRDTRTFSALEDNETTFKLIWPDSEWAETGASVLMKPRDARVVVAFKTVDHQGRTLIDISRDFANVYPSGQDKPDEGGSTTDFTVEVMPDNYDALYDRLRLDASDSAIITPDVIRVAASGGDPEDP